MKLCQQCEKEPVLMRKYCPKCRNKREKSAQRRAVLLRQLKSYSAKLARIETELQNYETKSQTRN